MRATFEAGCGVLSDYGRARVVRNSEVTADQYLTVSGGKRAILHAHGGIMQLRLGLCV